MRNYLKKTGLTAIIIIAIIATAFFPRNVAQWIILGTVAAWGIANGVIFFINHKDSYGKHSIKRKTSRKKLLSRKKDTNIPLDFRYARTQLAHRITDKLQSAYPGSSWDWLERPTAGLFTNGGYVAIKTADTGEFTEADVYVDSIGRIDIKMLTTESISNIIKSKCEDANTDYTIDVGVWYEQRGEKYLNELITDLNSKGTRTLTILEDGSITISGNKEVGKLEAFPTKNLWKQLVELFERDELKAVEYADSIQLGW